MSKSTKKQIYNLTKKDMDFLNSIPCTQKNIKKLVRFQYNTFLNSEELVKNLATASNHLKPFLSA